MKNIFYTAIFLAAAFCIYAFMNPKADFNKDSNDGIQFYRGTWKEVLEKARKENKLIFLDIYASWCGPCKRLKNSTFSNNRVGKYFNSNFINVSLDGEAGDGEVLANQYRISAYPSLFFIDKNGTVIKQAQGYHDVSELMKLGRSAIK